MKFELDLDFNLLKQQRQLLETLCGIVDFKKRCLLEGILTLIEDINRQKAVAEASDKAVTKPGRVSVSFNEADGVNLQASVKHHA